MRKAKERKEMERQEPDTHVGVRNENVGPTGKGWIKGMNSQKQLRPSHVRFGGSRVSTERTHDDLNDQHKRDTLTSTSGALKNTTHSSNSNGAVSNTHTSAVFYSQHSAEGSNFLITTCSGSEWKVPVKYVICMTVTIRT